MSAASPRSRRSRSGPSSQETRRATVASRGARSPSRALARGGSPPARTWPRRRAPPFEMARCSASAGPIRPARSHRPLLARRRRSRPTRPPPGGARAGAGSRRTLHVAIDEHGSLAQRAQCGGHLRDDGLGRFVATNDLDHRHQQGRIPVVRADCPRSGPDRGADGRDRNRGGIGGDDGVGIRATTGSSASFFSRSSTTDSTMIPPRRRRRSPLQSSSARAPRRLSDLPAHARARWRIHVIRCGRHHTHLAPARFARAHAGRRRTTTSSHRARTRTRSAIPSTPGRGG